MKKSLFTIALKWGALLAITLSACEVVKMFARQIEYEAGAVFSLLLLIILILFGYAATKEYRDTALDGFIRFPKAFATAATTMLIAAVLFFGYMLAHYQFIDKDGLNRINQRNVEIFNQKIQNDTITQSLLNQYIDESFQLVDETHAEMNFPTECDSCQSFIDQSLTQITEAYKDRLLLCKQKDTTNYTFKNFPDFAQHTFLDVYQNFLSQNENSPCGTQLSQIMNNSYIKIQNIDLLEQARKEQEKNIPHYTSIVPIALSSAISALLFGLFVNLFVALYLTKKKPEANPEETAEGQQESVENNQNQE